MSAYVINENGERVDFEAAANIMDDETREQVAREIAPCPDQEFFDAYAKAHEDRFGEAFAPYAGMAW